MDDSSSIDPYRPPQSSPEPDAFRAGTKGPLEWSPVEAFTFAWETLRAHPICILVAFVATIVTQVIPSIAQVIQLPFQFEAQRTGSDELPIAVLAISAAGALINMPIAVWMALGQARYALHLARGERPPFSLLFKADNLLTVLGATLLIVLVMTVIMVAFLLVPGILFMRDPEDGQALLFLFLAAALAMVPIAYLGLRVFLSTQAAADGVRGTFAALGRSWECTRGQFWIFVGFFLLALALAIAAFVLGALACCIGLLVTMPANAIMLQIASAYAYLMRTGEKPVLLQRAS